MRTLRAAVALLVVVMGVLVGAPPAFAGNWVVTVLDPVPERFEAGHAYTIGFWALQHGSHPFEGTFESIGLKIIDADGNPLMYSATALPEPAHFATTVLVPRSGTWTVYGMHSPFQDYKIGTLTVPGGLSVLPIPQPMPLDKDPWGEIRPPTVPIDPDRGPFDDGRTTIVGPQAQPTTGAPAAEAAQSRPASGSGRSAPTVLAILAATALLLGLILANRRRRAPATAPVADRLDMHVGEPTEPTELTEPEQVSSRS
jgi:hypothetical protein